MPLEKIFLRGINPTLPTVYDDGLSYMEAVAKLQSKINECIDLIQKADVEGVQRALKEALEYVDKTVQNVDSKLAEQLTEVDLRISALLTAVERDIAETNQANELLIENAIIELERFIAQMSLTVQATNPLNGRQEALNKSLGVTDSICRNFALSARHYDSLEVTATKYNEFNVSAYNYDLYGNYYVQNLNKNYTVSSDFVDSDSIIRFVSLPYGVFASLEFKLKSVNIAQGVGGDGIPLLYWYRKRVTNIQTSNKKIYCGFAIDTNTGLCYPLYFWNYYNEVLSDSHLCIDRVGDIANCVGHNFVCSINCIDKGFNFDFYGG